MAIDLTQREIDEFMLSSPVVILCVAREGRAPLAVPMWFGWADNTIYLNTALASKKVGYIRENPLVSCLVETGRDYYELKSVLLMGRCEINENQAEVNADAWREWLHAVKPLYREIYPKILPPHLARFYAEPRATLVIKPYGTTTWDFAKIRV